MPNAHKVHLRAFPSPGSMQVCGADYDVVRSVWPAVGLDLEEVTCRRCRAHRAWRSFDEDVAGLLRQADALGIPRELIEPSWSQFGWSLSQRSNERIKYGDNPTGNLEWIMWGHYQRGGMRVSWEAYAGEYIRLPAPDDRSNAEGWAALAEKYPRQLTGRLGKFPGGMWLRPGYSALTPFP